MGDPDYIDVTRLNESEEEDTEDVSGTPVKRRGKDLSLVELELFNNKTEYDASEVKREIDDLMIKRKEWKTEWATNWSFTCKYHKKKGFYSCPKQLRVCFLCTSTKIQVFTNDEEH